jgi:predicted nucleic acid-binding protein
MDAMIAALALSHRAVLATRNTADFAGLGFDIVNPFDFQ